MSQKNGGRDPEAYERIFIKQGDRPVELVMPPMDKQAKWDMERCARFVLDMCRTARRFPASLISVITIHAILI